MSDAGHILTAVDFSPSSASALHRAFRIASWNNAPLTALHVVDPRPFLSAVLFLPEVLGMPVPPTDDLAAVARQQWDSFALRSGAAGTPLTVEVGVPRDAILDAVERLEPSLLVLGAHGASDASRGLGATAAACAKWAPAPVLVVREGQDGPFRSVVACIDFGDDSRLALEQAISVALEDGAGLHILHVYSDPWRGHPARRGIEQNMPDFADRYRSAVLNRLRTFCEPFAHEIAAARPAFHAVEAHGHTVGILDFVRSQGCDLAVLGSRSRRTVRDFARGSTAERVVREAPCSVLISKPPSSKRKEPAESSPVAAVPARACCGTGACRGASAHRQPDAVCKEHHS